MSHLQCLAFKPQAHKSQRLLPQGSKEKARQMSLTGLETR